MGASIGESYRVAFPQRVQHRDQTRRIQKLFLDAGTQPTVKRFLSQRTYDKVLRVRQLL
jgi:hypothetical protein